MGVCLSRSSSQGSPLVRLDKCVILATGGRSTQLPYVMATVLAKQRTSWSPKLTYITRLNAGHPSKGYHVPLGLHAVPSSMPVLKAGSWECL